MAPGEPLAARGNTRGKHLRVTTRRVLRCWYGVVRYEIRIEGVLDDCWSAWFDGMQVTSHTDGMTAIAGAVTDQAALHGLLAKVRDLGLPLVSVRRVGP